MNASDCDDDAVSVNPDADELCNGVDDDCDGLNDNNAQDAQEFYFDNDGDGFGGSCCRDVRLSSKHKVMWF